MVNADPEFSEKINLERVLLVDWRVYFFGFFGFLGLKLLLIYLFGWSLFEFGGENDSDYYDFIAMGGDAEVVNIWPTLLFYLNEMGFYSRSGVSIFLLILSSLIIPYLTAKLCVVDGFERKSVFWFSMCVLSLYPVLFFFSLDIYRDVFMIFIFLLGVFALRGIVEKRGWGWNFIALILFFPLYALRGYLGAAYVLTVFFALVNKFFEFKMAKKINLYFLVILYLLLIYSVFLLGGFSRIIDYRDGFENLGAGSTFGLDMHSVFLFLPNFLLNWLFQVFGLWFLGGSALFLFLIESLPFGIAFFYVFKNIKYASKFVISLLVFFVIYNTIWILGNDNLGTAWRLRSFGYISIYISFVIICQEKLKIKLKNKFQ